MELTYVGIAVLASMVFVLAGMVGYLYWQQTMILKNMRELAMMVSNLIAPPPPSDTTQFFGVYENSEDFDKEHPIQEEKKEESSAEDSYSADDEESDDESTDNRLSVHDKVEHVAGPPATEEKAKIDVDDLQNRTVAQLRELLTEKGIPFGKRDPKTILIQLLKATA